MKTHLFSVALLVAAMAPLCAAPADPGYTAHEWGTFTSVQGADGVQMDWNPLTVSELPPFVYELNRVRGKNAPALLLAKTGMVCKQRMETPVIYFYSDRERTLDVAVDFPQGTITEWYPLESAADLSIRRPGQPQPKRPALEWKNLRVLPPDATVDGLPTENSGSHYYAARETDASLVSVTTSDKKSEIEKFLFYRGTGNFAAPLTVTLEDKSRDVLQLTNTGAEPLSAVFVLEVRGNEGRVFGAGNLAPGAYRKLPLLRREAFRPLEQIRARLGGDMRAALVAAGLYEREAAAMVNTWEASWFAEQGTRVLYILPRAWTDRVLPLTIQPAPAEVARVMVGRAEVITPAMEQTLLKQVERYIAASESERPAVVADTRALGYGRFMEPTLRRLFAGVERSKEFSTHSWELLTAATIPKPKSSGAVGSL
jgi:hypothetical protein